MNTKSGKAIFPVGIGTWNISSVYRPENDGTKYRGVEPVYGNEQAEIEAIRYSIAKGQNHLDCAEMYGGFYTDEVVGKALKGLEREDLFVADKLWKPSVAMGKVRPTVEQMLTKLGTDYLDMLYIHAPWDGVPWQEAIPQIDALIDEGIVRNFGVSNFTIEHMQATMTITKHSIAANQMSFNVLYKDEVNQSFLDFCKQNSIEVVAYHPVKHRAVLEDPTLIKIAKAHDVSPAQVAIAWLLAKGTLPIPKATQKEHIDDNVAAISLSLRSEEMTLLDNL